MKDFRITVKRASDLTGLSQLTIRKGIENGELDFGKAIHSSKVRTIYHISPGKLAEYLRISLEEVLGEKNSKIEEKEEQCK